MYSNFLFLSDFDGTISKKDFYLKFAKGDLIELDTKLLTEVHAGRLSSFEYLNQILLNLNMSKVELQEEILSLEVDEFVAPLVNHITTSGGEFKVVSAGSSYYIRPILDKMKLESVELIANGGSFINSGIEMFYPEEEKYHCSYYGIKKENIVEEMRKKYSTILFAGDGSADFEAAKASDICFAKNRLAEKLSLINHPFIQFNTFEDIYNYLKINFFNKIT